VRDINQIEDILQSLPDEYSVAVIRVLPKIGNEELTEEKGKFLESIWSNLRNINEGIEECRCLWDEMLVFHSNLNLSQFENEVATMLKDIQHKDLETHSIFTAVSGNSSDALKCIEEAQLQLHKVNYWDTHKYEYYYVNGQRKTLNKT